MESRPCTHSFHDSDSRLATIISERPEKREWSEYRDLFTLLGCAAVVYLLLYHLDPLLEKVVRALEVAR